MRDIEREAGVEKKMARIGEWLQAVQEGRGAGDLEGARVTGFTMRLPTEEEPATLLVVKASGKSGKHIAFVGAFTVGDALLAWRARSEKGRMKWREDVPWAER